MRNLSLILAIIFLFSSCNQSNSQKQSNDFEQNTLEQFNFNGLTFSYIPHWVIQQNILRENFNFTVICASNSGTIGIKWWRSTKYPPEVCLDDMVKFNTSKGIPSGEYYNDIFGNVNCVAFDYLKNGRVEGEILYGKFQSFVINGNTVLIVKTNFIKDNLDTEFSLIEESFNLK